MGLEGTTKGVRTGVARRTGHLANEVSRVAEQRLGLGEPNFFQEVVEGHSRRLTEQGREMEAPICIRTFPGLSRLVQAEDFLELALDLLLALPAHRSLAGMELRFEQAVEFTLAIAASSLRTSSGRG